MLSLLFVAAQSTAKNGKLSITGVREIRCLNIVYKSDNLLRQSSLEGI